MANKRDDKFIQDECVDNLSDVPIEFGDSEEVEESTCTDEKQSDAESSDDSEIRLQRIQQILLSSDTEESDEDYDTEWTDFDLPKDNNEFEDSLGPNVFPGNVQNVEDSADLFIGKDFFEFISIETNRYYIQNSDKNKEYKKSAKFVDVTAPELKKWFALLILMGLIKKPRIDDYWSTNPLLETPIFRKTMSRNRFRQILSFLHFSDNSRMPENSDRLFKVQHIMDYFSKKFRENFNPGQNIFINEAMIPWHGELNFKVYKPSKMIKYGILIHMLCDCSTGYVLSYKIYSDVGQTLNSVVIELLTHYFGKWYHVYMNNYYNSLDLVENLFKKKIQVCGMIRQNRGYPTKLKNSKLNIYETAFQRNGEILALSWKASNNKIIRIISTIHNADLVDSQKICRKSNRRIPKPKCVLDYDKYMKGVDYVDQYLRYNPIYKKSIKWSKKVVLYLFNCALFNSFKVYQHFNATSKNLRFHNFLLKLCEAWLKNILPDTEENSDAPTTLRASHRDLTDRLSGQLKQHQLIQICQTDKRKRRSCRVCYANKIRRTTNLMCKSCGVPLHLGDCFASYHLKEKY